MGFFTAKYAWSAFMKTVAALHGSSGIPPPAAARTECAPYHPGFGYTIS